MKAQGQEPAREALDDFAEALAKLDAGCCDPGRSPRMRALADSLEASRRAIASVHDPASAETAIQGLEDMGAQIGRLQVGCCTEKRLPLYARMLEDLTDAQLAISRDAGTAH
ncbi:MAG TPA: hypothetical protein VK960_06255 [Acidimicrobiia bacterium]|nr:hypothetical protein [Acidimicrobiia bacterium]